MVKRMLLRGNERGSALVTVFMVTMVLILLGAGLVHYASVAFRQVTAAETRARAYYIARSGVDAFVSYVVDNPDGLSSAELDDLIDNVIAAGTSSPTALGDGAFTLAVTREGSDAILVAAVGDVRGVTETVRRTILIAPDVPGIPPLDMAVFALNSIKMEGSAKIYGDAATNSVADRSVDFAWSTGFDDRNGRTLWIGPGGNASNVVKAPNGSPMDEYVKQGKVKNLPEPREYPLPEFPEFPLLPYKGDFTAGWWPSPPYSITEADGDGWYGRLAVESELNIYVGSGTRIIRADELSVTGDGKMNIIGSGKLILYVNKFVMDGGASINRNGSESQLHMYYSGTGKLSLGGNTKFRGSVYAKDAPIDITNSGGITGHIITGGSEVKITGDATAHVRVLYAPNAAVRLEGSGKVRGSLIGKTVHMSGGTFVEWKEIPDSQGGIPDLESGAKTFKRGQWK